jgi:LCP family protein required for cell wall assembly
VLAAILVIAPHAAAVAAGLAAQPLLAQVLVTKATPPNAAAPPAPEAEMAAAESEASRALWDGTGRLNVLLMGTDRRPQEAAERPWGNSDTLLLVSLEAGGRSAVMISIPRDLYLDVPGVGPEKINAAYREGGPPLAVRVVGDLLRLPVHRWAAIDISAFARMIDALGGVVVDVERPIRDDEYPAENYAVRRILLQAGLQWLDGERALWYARSRHGSTDFDRAARQQRLLLSLKERARDPRTIERLPLLVGTLAEAIQTDVSPREALVLARLATSPDVRSEIHSLVLTPPAYGRVINRPELYAIQPDVPRIRAAVADILSGKAAPGVVAGPAPAQDDPADGDGPEETVPGQGGAPDDQFQEVEVPGTP